MVSFNTKSVKFFFLATKCAWDHGSENVAAVTEYVTGQTYEVSFSLTSCQPASMSVRTGLYRCLYLHQNYFKLVYRSALECGSLNMVKYLLATYWFIMCKLNNVVFWHLDRFIYTYSKFDKFYVRSGLKDRLEYLNYKKNSCHNFADLYALLF